MATENIFRILNLMDIQQIEVCLKILSREVARVYWYIKTRLSNTNNLKIPKYVHCQNTSLRVSKMESPHEVCQCQVKARYEDISVVL